jgi:hypothetical protein
MRIDHVTFAGSDLVAMRAAFDAAGFPTIYGGAHSNGITHMAVIPFRDGSYIELISTIPDADPSLPHWWSSQIRGDAGPCGWAVHEEGNLRDLANSIKLPYRGPVSMERRRPDGETAAWDVLFLGQGEPGATLPFIIQDRTDRRLRVPPVEGAWRDDPTLPSGVTDVLIGVRSLDAITPEFQRLLGEPLAHIKQDDRFQTTIASFNSGIHLVAATTDANLRMNRQINQFGESPICYLLRVDDFDGACERFPVDSIQSWLGRPLAWIDSGPTLPEYSLGFISGD